MSVKDVGDRLAKVAASSGIASKQLRELLKAARTRSLDDLEAVVKYQVGRCVRGYKEFGEAFLQVLDQHRQDKIFIENVLNWICLTTDYYSTEKISNIKPQIEDVAKRIASRFGYQRTEISAERGLSIDIYVSRFPNDPRTVSDQIKEELRRYINELRETEFQVWINPRRR
ncbi:hypothetical protein KEJ39_06585 [Candidatus Bathyarchaeota archaeon]|nr:hypothetical protein [Candidatus Bathyarchaeota archaeon]